MNGRRRSRVDRLNMAAEHKEIKHKYVGAAAAARRQPANYGDEAFWDQAYPTLPSKQQHPHPEEGREEAAEEWEAVPEHLLRDEPEPKPEPTAELASSALLAAAAELQSSGHDLAALAEMFPEEELGRLQGVLVRSGSLHAAAGQLLAGDDSVESPPAAADAAEQEAEAEGLPWLLSRFQEELSSDTVRHVFFVAGSDSDTALETLTELTEAAEAAALPVDVYLALLAQQAAEETAAAGAAARGEQASEVCIEQLLNAERAEEGRRSLLRKVALTAPARTRQVAQLADPTRRSQQAGQPSALPRVGDDERLVQLDLHGHTVKDGLSLLRAEILRVQELEPLRTGRARKLVAVTGRGSHSAGPVGRAPLRAAVERHLSAAGLSFAEQHGGGAFEVRV